MASRAELSALRCLKKGLPCLPRLSGVLLAKLATLPTRHWAISSQVSQGRQAGQGLMVQVGQAGQVGQASLALAFVAQGCVGQAFLGHHRLGLRLRSVRFSIQQFFALSQI